MMLIPADPPEGSIPADAGAEGVPVLGAAVGAGGAAGVGTALLDAMDTLVDEEAGGASTAGAGGAAAAGGIGAGADDEPEPEEASAPPVAPLLGGITLVNIGVFQLDWLPEVCALAVSLMISIPATMMNESNIFFMRWGLTG